MKIDKNYYDKDYFCTGGVKGWYDESAFSIKNLWHKQLVEFYIEIFSHSRIKPEGKMILDIGCALGNVPYWFNQLGYSAFGLDLSDWAVANCHLPGKIFQGDICEDFPFEEAFDYIVTRETLEHIYEEKIDKAVKNIFSLMKESGLGLIAAANNRVDKEIKKQRDSVNADPSHVTIKPLYWWLEKFRTVGFKIDYDTTLFAGSLDWSQKYDWDLLVITK